MDVHGSKFQFVCVLLVVFMFGVAGSAAEKWSYFDFKAGQRFQYEVKSERGLSGDVTIEVVPADGNDLAITISGNWFSTFSETAILTPGMSPADFIYSFENFEIPNTITTLMNLHPFLVENLEVVPGFSCNQNEHDISVAGAETVAGRTGLHVVHVWKHEITRRQAQEEFWIDPDCPLPIIAVCPAANDTWTYRLVAVNGL